VNNRPEQRGHYFKPIPLSLFPEIQFLSERFSRSDLNDITEDECHVIEQNSSRRVQCGMLVYS
jgi:hypothetical protein